MARRGMLEKLREEKRKAMEPQELTLEGFATLLCAGKEGKAPKLNTTQWAFMCEAEKHAAFMGAAGTSKTSTICAIGLMRAIFMMGSRGVVGRHDYNDLMDTTQQRLKEMLRRLPPDTLIGEDKKPPAKWLIKPAEAWGKSNLDSSWEPSEITFMGMKEELGSYEYNWAIVDEADEVEEKVILALDGRLRYPRPGAPRNEDGRIPRDAGEYALRLAFNPPDKHHWLYTACTGRDFRDQVVKNPWLKLYTPHATENRENLPEGYIEDRVKNLPEDMAQRLISGEWGSVHPGTPVYGAFRSGVHAPKRLQWDQLLPMMRFWDFGYVHPAVIWAQMDQQGRLKCLAEHMGSYKEIGAFVDEVRTIQAQLFPGLPERRITDYGDPAADQQKDTGRTTAELYARGIILRFQSSKINTGIELIRGKLNTLIGGEPALQVSNVCHILCSAFRGGYRLDDSGKKPFKDGYYDHLMDALRYGCINTLGNPSGIHTAEGLPDNLAYQSEQDPYV